MTGAQPPRAARARASKGRPGPDGKTHGPWAVDLRRVRGLAKARLREHGPQGQLVAAGRPEQGRPRRGAMQGAARLGRRGISAPTLAGQPVAQGAARTEDLLEGLLPVPERSGGTGQGPSGPPWGRWTEPSGEERPMPGGRRPWAGAGGTPTEGRRPEGGRLRGAKASGTPGGRPAWVGGYAGAQNLRTLPTGRGAAPVHPSRSRPTDAPRSAYPSSPRWSSQPPDGAGSVPRWASAGAPRR